VFVEARRFDCCLDADLFLERGFRVSWEFEARRVDGSIDSSLFLERGLGVSWEFEARRVDGSLDSSLFTIGWLEARSVFTLGHVNLSLVVMATVTGNLDGDISVVVSSVVWELDVDVSSGVLVVGSEEKREVR
jgi:hypothetical protein